MPYYRGAKNQPHLGEVVLLDETFGRPRKRCVVLEILAHGRGFVVRALQGGERLIVKTTEVKRFPRHLRGLIQRKAVESYGVKMTCVKCHSEFTPMLSTQYVESICLPCTFSEDSHENQSVSRSVRRRWFAGK
jgi:hypothetical protein